MAHHGGKSMSFSQKPETAGLSPSAPGRRNTFTEAESVPFGLGYFRVAPKWITDRFNDHWSNGKTTGQAYCSVAGILCHGPIDKVRSIFQAGAEIMILDRVRPDNPADPDYWYLSAQFGGPDKELGPTWSLRLYWGRENQPADAWLQQKTGQDHPPYQGQAYVIFERAHCGQIQADSKARPALPNIEFSVQRLVSPSAPSSLRLPQSIGPAEFRGVNIVGGLWDILTHQRGGLGLTSSFLDEDYWSEKAQALENGQKPAAGLFGSDTYVSPLLTGGSEAEQIITDALSYIDGFIFTSGGKLRLDWYPNDGTIPESLPEITHHDLVEEPQIKTSSLSEAPTTIVVECLDGDRQTLDLSPAAETAHVPFVREIAGDTSVKKLQRPWFTSRSIASSYAARYASTATIPEMSGEISVRSDRAVRLDAHPLRPGDIFRFNWAPASLLVVARITERLEDYTSVKLRWVRERGMASLPYVPSKDPRQLYALPDPEALGDLDWTIAEAPAALSDSPAVICLARRPSIALTGMRVYLDEDGNWDSGATLIGFQAFGARFSLSGPLSNDSTSATLVGFDPDCSPTLASGCTITEQSDDTLVALIGSEWCSFGAVTSVGTGIYSAAIARGRLGSSSTAHAVEESVWVIRRDRLTLRQHAAFTPRSTKHFKVQTYHALADSEMSASKSVTFRDRTPGNVGLVTALAQTNAISLKWPGVSDTFIGDYEVFEQTSAIPVPSEGTAPSFRTPTTNHLRGGLTAGVQMWFWVRARDNDKRIGPWSNAATAIPEAAGAQGPQGLTGPQGPAGLQGLQGPAGTNGVDGLSMEYSYSTDGANWHTSFSIGDIYTRHRLTGGTWGAAIRFVGVDGSTGQTGPMGPQGATGTRGSKEFTRDMGSQQTWSDDAANAAISGSGYAKVDRDVVTLFSTQGNGWSQTRVWNGSTWETLAQILDGSLLVRGSITANAIGADQVRAIHVGTNLLIANAANIGTGVIESAHIKELAAAKILAGDMQAVNLAVASRLRHPSYPSTYFESDEFVPAFNSNFTWSAGNAFNFNHATPAVLYGPGYGSSPCVCPNPYTGLATFKLSGRIWGYTGSITIYYRINGGTMLAAAGVGSADGGDAVLPTITRKIALSTTDRIEFYCAPCNTDGFIASPVSCGLVTLEVDAINW
jgi:hypothetical protein